jgi:serine/threonine protein kinase
MGVVYKALDPLLDRLVALKTISAHLDSAPELRTKFFREGRSAAQLSHKNIITIYDLGENDGTAYMAMEYLDGKDLKARIQNKEFTTLQAQLRIMVEICDALSHAHARQVVHMDIKPGNVFLTTAGQVKILDFGLARVMSADVTRTGAFPGTPSYMSPEQVCGDSIDHRTDIFSAGSLFYELLTSRKPFDGDSLTATIARILHHEPMPLEQVDPAIDTQLAAIVRKALAKNPDDRYQSIDEMLLALKSFAAKRCPGALTEPLPPDAGANQPPEDARGKFASTSLESAASLKRSAPAPMRSTAPPSSAVPDSRRGIFARPLWLVTAVFAVTIAAVSVWWATRNAVPQRPAPDVASGTHSPVGIGVQPAEAMKSNTRLPAGAIQPGDVQPAPSSDAASGNARKVPQSQIESHSTGSPVGADATAGLPAEGNRRAKALMAAEATSLEVKRVADTARDQMMTSKRTAEQANAAQFAAKSLAAAQAQENEAQNLYSLRHYEESASKFFSAGGMYLSSAAEAQAEKSGQDSRAKLDEQEKQKRLQRGQADQTRRSYEQERLDAAKAEAETKAAQKYQEALRLASEAHLLWDHEDYVGAQKNFDKATEIMHQARVEAQDAVRKVEPASVSTPKPIPPPPPANTPEIDRGIIAGILQQYVTCLQSRDLPGLKKIWPGLAGPQERALQDEFDTARKIQVQFSDVQITINGDAATLSARRSYAIQAADGSRHQSETRTTVALRKSGKTWFIDQMSF